MRRVLTFLLTTTIVLGVGLGASGAAATASRANPDAHADTTTAKVTSVDVAFDYPAAWVEVSLNGKTGRALRRKMLEANPQFAEQFDQRAAEAASQHLEFSAVDLAGQLGGRAHGAVNVQRLGELPSGRAEIEHQLSRVFEGLGGELVAVRQYRLHGEKVTRVDCRLPLRTPDGETLPIYEGMLVVRRGLANVAVAVAVDDDADSLAIVDSILATVRHA